MAYVVIQEFSVGLDARRHPMMAPPGSLRVVNNAHITRGGEIGKRRAFAPWQALPLGTIGLAVARSRVYVFGSGAPPSVMPPLVNYQQLVHPSGIPIHKILSWDVFNGKIYVVARFQDGSVCHFYDGVLVPDWQDGRARCALTVVEGIDANSALNSIKIAGVEIVGVPVAWQGNAEDTAQVIVDQINAFGSFPEYEASRFGATVNIAAADTGSDANARPVIPIVSGGLVLDPETTALAGGVDLPAGVFPPGNYVKTAQQKMYATAGSLMHFSGIGAPTVWEGVTGAGFVNMAGEDGQSQQLVAMERYYSRLAVFARHCVQIWTIDVDPAKNVQYQTLRNTGLVAPNSVEQVGDADTFYLSDSGLRSLRARDSSTAAAVNDVGTPIDDILVARIRELGPAVTAEACSVIEPIAGRYWLALGDIIYVFTQFPGAKVAAWTTYSPGFVPEAFVTVNNQVVCRAGNTLYKVGGAEINDFDFSLCEVELPLLDMGKPAHFKKFSAIELVIEGQWRVYGGFEPLSLGARDLIGQFSEPTLSKQRIALDGYGTHANFRLESDYPGYAKLASFVVHYELADVG